MSSPHAIFFDAGGTLVLQDPVAMAQRLAFDIDPDRAFDAHYRTMAEFADLKRSGDTETTWHWFLERFFERLGHPDPAAAGPAIDFGYLLWRWVIPGVVQAVEHIAGAGIRVGVVSNSDGSVTESLTMAGLAGMFEFVIDSAEVGFAKPDAAIFAMACERMGVDCDRAWYVGDSMHHDIDGALAAGLGRAVLVDPLALHPGADRVNGVAELPSLIDLPVR